MLAEEKTEERVEERPVEEIEEKAQARDLVLLEAALYVAGRPLDLRELASVLKTRSKKRVQRTAQKLIDLYITRETALEILPLE